MIELGKPPGENDITSFDQVNVVSEILMHGSIIRSERRVAGQFVDDIGAVQHFIKNVWIKYLGQKWINIPSFIALICNIGKNGFYQLLIHNDTIRRSFIP